jgi:hypothetical protein
VSNKRQHKRLRIDRSVRVPVHLFTKMPFIGEAISASLINLSAGGMALGLDGVVPRKTPKKGGRLKIHFRLPGRPLQECWGVVTHVIESGTKGISIGIRFERCPAQLQQELEHMANDNHACDVRIEQKGNAWCLPTCSFMDLCRKPIRPEPAHSSAIERIEIALQTHDEITRRK